jgi:hypothetical protein
LKDGSLKPQFCKYTILALDTIGSYSLPLMTITNLSPAQLRRAADIKEKITSLESELSRLLGTSTAPSVNSSSGPKRKMSAASRKKIADAKKKWWAAKKAAKK